MSDRIVHCRVDAILTILGTLVRLSGFDCLPTSEPMGSRTVNADRERAPTVLVVDDEPVVCTVTCDCLRDAGFRTLEAHSAQQAIALLEKGVRVDVVFSDVQMPGMDGFALQRWIREHQPRVRVLLASGVENVKAASGHIGSPRWLVFKPYSSADLEQRIRDLLHD
jgi:two-component system, response regulator PdtaR